MTRINILPPVELCDQHLLAEARELPRIPNGVLKGLLSRSYADAPTEYVLGPGHVKFFVDKLGYLESRYSVLLFECALRGFSVENRWPKDLVFSDVYVPTCGWQSIIMTRNDCFGQRAQERNRERILDRLRSMKRKPTWTLSEIPTWVKEEICLK